MVAIGGGVWARSGSRSQALDGPLPESQSFVARVYYDEIGDLTRLYAYDVWEYNNLSEWYVLVTVDAAHYQALIELGWAVEIDTAATAQLRQATRSGDFYGGYRTVDELYSDLETINAAAPELTEIVDYGESHCLTAGGCETLGGETLPGYALRAMRITNEAVPGGSEITPGGIVRGSKPVFVLMANIHSREITTPELAMRFIDALIDGYGVDADATWLVDHHETWVIPTANPDGHWLVTLGVDATYGGFPFYQRKNANNDANDNGKADCSVWPPAAFEQYGIDLNRNHTFGWGSLGASNRPCDMTYRGPAPASEVETAALESLVAALIPDQREDDLQSAAPPDTTGILITLHSFSNLVLWPWGNSEAPAPNIDDLRAIGDKLATYNNYLSCQPSTCLYLTSGSSDDWAYGKLGIPAFTFEIGDQFMPPYTTIDAVQWPQNGPAFLYAAKIARTPYQTAHGPDTDDLEVNAELDGLTIRGMIDDSANGGEIVVGGVYSIDTPPWDAGATLHDLGPVDGQWDATMEAVSAVIDTDTLSAGRHMLFVQGADAAKNVGAVSAVFFDVESEWTFEKEVRENIVAPGAQLHYEIAMSLEGTDADDAYTVAVTDTLPADVSVEAQTILVNGNPRPDLYDPTTRTIRYDDAGTFDDTFDLWIQFTAVVSESAASGQWITNQVMAEATLNGAPLPLPTRTAAALVLRDAVQFFMPFVLSP